METAEFMAKFLELYGGWGVAVLLCVTVVYMYRDFKITITAKDTLIQTINKKHHEEIVAVVRECTGVLASVEETLDRCERRSERIGGK